MSGTLSGASLNGRSGDYKLELLDIRLDRTWFKIKFSLHFKKQITGFVGTSLPIPFIN